MVHKGILENTNVCVAVNSSTALTVTRGHGPRGPSGSGTVYDLSRDTLRCLQLPDGKLSS